MFQFFDPNSLTRKAKLNARVTAGLVEIKSKFAAEFRRFSIDASNPPSLEAFQNLLRSVHKLNNTPFSITYTDKEGDLLPINNQDNFTHALKVSRPLLRLCLHHADNHFQQGFGAAQPKKNILSKLLETDAPTMRSTKRIGLPENFRYVSAIIDADILPPTQRRVKLIRNSTQKPLGFFVKDGFSIHPTSSGSLERVAGVFISRLVPGGLAESTGLLAANDEVLEVNGIEVAGKSLDQVTDMMVANSGHLIITIKPCNQYSQITLPPPSNPPLISSSFNDLSRASFSKPSSKANVADSRVTHSMHDLNAVGKAGGGEGVVREVVDDDDVREFVRRDPSGSSSSNRDSAQLLQQQQLEQLQQLTLQKEQLEEQLKLQQQQQQRYDLQKQYQLQEHEQQKQQQLYQQQLLQQQKLQKLQEQQQFLQQYELQQQLKQQNTLLPEYNHPEDENIDKISLKQQKDQGSPRNNYNNSPFSTHINFPDIQPPTKFSNQDNNNNNHYYNNNLQKFSRNVLIKDLQSLDQLDKNSYDEENIRFVEGGAYEETDVFGNSSLRINSNSNVRSRLSTRSVDHHMKKRKDMF